MNEILWTPRALRQLRKIQADHALQIRRAVSLELVDLNKARNVKALAGHGCEYRLRVGSYRVLFSVVEGKTRIVLVEEVRKRDERTY